MFKRPGISFIGLMGLLSLAVGLSGCRGDTSREPPVHLNPNMDVQDKYKPYRKSTFFTDGRSMRKPPQGTVARGQLRADTKLHCGKDDSSDCASKDNVTYIEKLPISLTLETMKRGRDRYNIYCAPCHAKDGFGGGKVALRSMDLEGVQAIKPPTFHSTRLGKMPVGEIYHTIAYGSKSGAMYGYRHQITDVNDRWAIVAYIRALQRSQDASASMYVKPKPAPPVEAIPTGTEGIGVPAADGTSMGDAANNTAAGSPAGQAVETPKTVDKGSAPAKVAPAQQAAPAPAKAETK
ncbi:MAG: cytochrome c [Myxococcota bacterium]|nr:cytochrome c [Myxococcota bacterium]